MYGNRLRELREEKELTQKELANVLGITKEGYGQYEREYVVIPIKHLITIAIYYDLSIDNLFGFNLVNDYQIINKQVDKKLSGMRLREFRKNHRFTQKKLADILRTTQSVIADYEKGRYLIATPFLYMICNNYRVSADYILGRVDNPKFIK